MMATRLANTMTTSLKGRPVQVEYYLSFINLDIVFLIMIWFKQSIFAGPGHSRTRATAIYCTLSAYGCLQGTYAVVFLLV